MSIRCHSLPLYATVGAAIVVVLAACGNAGDVSGTPDATEEKQTDTVTAEEFGYTKYDALLRAHVDSEGYVDYPGLLAKRADLDRFVASMGAVTDAEYTAWPEPERLAFWINAYNAITLQYILDHYPIQKGGLISGLRYPANSIRQIDGVWDTLTSKVVGKERTLEDIEHEILRAQFGDARIHVAIVCASIGCPPLRNEAFVADTLEEQLDAQARTFLSDPTKFRIDRTGSTVHISSIFKWFGKDFVPKHGTDSFYAGHNTSQRAVLGFIAGYASPEDAKYLKTASYSIEYQDYDWSLNER